jgi:Fe-S-cluster-containing hydrogenase component 2
VHQLRRLRAECPNEAISEGEDIYVIDPNLCTECVGFHDYEACQAVCPVECCIPNEQNVESEETLLSRAVKLHPDKTFPGLDALPPTSPASVKSSYAARRVAAERPQADVHQLGARRAPPW